MDVILTQAAVKFITPLTFQSVTGRRVFTDDDFWGHTGHVLHIGLAKNADHLAIAPISANTLAKLAHGIAYNLLTVTALASSCPLTLAPAMDGDMFTHPATQANLEILRQRAGSEFSPRGYGTHWWRSLQKIAEVYFGPMRMSEYSDMTEHFY